MKPTAYRSSQLYILTEKVEEAINTKDKALFKNMGIFITQCIPRHFVGRVMYRHMSVATYIGIHGHFHSSQGKSASLSRRPHSGHTAIGEAKQTSKTETQ